MDDLRLLPSVDKLLQLEEVGILIREYGRPLTLEAIRNTLQQIRESFSTSSEIPSISKIVEMVEHTLEDRAEPTLKPVINATGVILHTNLGRAPLSEAAMEAVRRVSCSYSNLEYDLKVGKRGSRLHHAEKILCQLTGAEAALVVNNNAAAVMLILAAFANRRSVVIACSQLVEIGGGFRIPDVMRQSGAKLLEIGATNRVHLSDYLETLEKKPAMFLVAHRSNFQILGFTSEPSINEIASAAHQAGIIMVYDLGSGTILDTQKYGLSHEPMVQEALAAGADLVCFSGDKLLGGPQAGIIVGKADLIEKARRHPLARAMRSDKMSLTALSATLLHYLKDEAETCIPVWKMISTHLDDIKATAQRWSSWLMEQGISTRIINGESTIGGGSLPGETLPTALLALSSSNPAKMLEQLRKATPPILARIENDLVVFDPRTVLQDQEEILLHTIKSLTNRS